MKSAASLAVATLLLSGGLAATRRAPLPVVIAADVPMYPRAALDARDSGDVVARVSTDGRQITTVHGSGRSSRLDTAAAENLKSWRFAPHEATSFDVTYHFEILTRGCEALGRDTHAAATLRFPTSVDVFAEVAGSCPGAAPPPAFGIYITRASVPFYPPGARDRGIEGEVSVNVSQKGELTIADGPDELAAPMLAAIRTWQFSPPPFPEPVRFTFKLLDGDCAAGGPTVSVGPGLTRFDVGALRACGRSITPLPPSPSREFPFRVVATAARAAPAAASR